MPVSSAELTLLYKSTMNGKCVFQDSQMTLGFTIIINIYLQWLGQSFRVIFEDFFLQRQQCYLCNSPGMVFPSTETEISQLMKHWQGLADAWASSGHETIFCLAFSVTGSYGDMEAGFISSKYILQQILQCFNLVVKNLESSSQLYSHPINSDELKWLFS